MWCFEMSTCAEWWCKLAKDRRAGNRAMWDARHQPPAPSLLWHMTILLPVRRAQESVLTGKQVAGDPLLIQLAVIFSLNASRISTGQSNCFPETTWPRWAGPGHVWPTSLQTLWNWLEQLLTLLKLPGGCSLINKISVKVTWSIIEQWGSWSFTTKSFNQTTLGVCIWGSGKEVWLLIANINRGRRSSVGDIRKTLSSHGLVEGLAWHPLLPQLIMLKHGHKVKMCWVALQQVCLLYSDTIIQSGRRDGTRYCTAQFFYYSSRWGTRQVTWGDTHKHGGHVLQELCRMLSRLSEAHSLLWDSELSSMWSPSNRVKWKTFWPEHRDSSNSRYQPPQFQMFPNSSLLDFIQHVLEEKQHLQGDSISLTCLDWTLWWPVTFSSDVFF